MKKKCFEEAKKGKKPTAGPQETFPSFSSISFEAEIDLPWFSPSVILPFKNTVKLEV